MPVRGLLQRAAADHGTSGRRRKRLDEVETHRQPQGEGTERNEEGSHGEVLIQSKNQDIQAGNDASKHDDITPPQMRLVVGDMHVKHSGGE